jgi:hypothetical protein
VLLGLSAAFQPFILEGVPGSPEELWKLRLLGGKSLGDLSCMVEDVVEDVGSLFFPCGPGAWLTGAAQEMFADCFWNESDRIKGRGLLLGPWSHCLHLGDW